MYSENLTSIIKNGRKRKGYSQKELGELTGISHQIISRYEKGQEIPTEERYFKILDALDIKHDDLEKNILEIDELFEKYISDQFYREVNCGYYIEKINHHYESYSICPNYYKIMIIEMVNGIMAGDNNSIDAHILVIEKLNISDNRALQIYYEYQGYYLLMKKETQTGLALLEKAKSLYYDEKVIAMIHYHMCFAHNYECLRKYDFDVINQALEVFQKYHSYKRIVNTLMIFGNFYDCKRNYERALKSYHDCINLMNLIKDNRLNFSKIYRTISYVHIKNNQYNQALKELEKAVMIEPNHSRMHLFYIWCYYKLNDINSANHWIVKMQRLNLDKELKMLWNLFDQLVHQYDRTPNDKLMNQAIKVYDYYRKEDDLDLMLFYVDIVIDLYEKREDYKNAYFYQKIKINLLESI